jgi:hypothetical protein
MRGQNARGAGRRFTPAQNELTRPFWAAWLKTVLAANPNVQVSDLVRQIAERPHDRDSHPRGLVRDWLEQKRTVSPSNAFRVGEAFRTLGLPWSSGPLALYAARHYVEFLRCIRSLWGSPSRAATEMACGLFVYSQVLVEYDTYGGFTLGVQSARRTKPLNRQAARQLGLVCELPERVPRIRRRLERGTERFTSEQAFSEGLLSSAPRFTGPNATTDERYLRPAIALLESKAPPSVGWNAVHDILTVWLHEALPHAADGGGATSVELWGDEDVVGEFASGELITSSVLWKDRALLEALPMARDFERFARWDRKKPPRAKPTQNPHGDASLQP